MIEITFKSGDSCKWDSDSFSDYRYDGTMFIIEKDGNWIGFYNVDCIRSIVITDANAIK